MKESYIGYAGFVPAEESDIMIRLRVLAGEVYRLWVNADFVSRQLFPHTAAGEYLDRHAQQRGLSRRSAAAATGTVTFYPNAEVHPAIVIPAGTELCSYPDLCRFRTDSSVTMEENAESAEANVTALMPGAASNARVGSVRIIVTTVPGIASAENESAFTTGCDAESDDDLRRRVIDSYVNIVSGANAAYYKSLALSVNGVYSASVVGRARCNGTVDVYVSGEGTTVPAAVKAQVQEKMNEGRELNVDVQVKDPQSVPITLYIRIAVVAGYDYQTVASEVSSAVSAFINALGIGRDVRISEIGEVVYHIKGVENYRFVESYGSDTVIADSQYPVAGSIIVRERT